MNLAQNGILSIIFFYLLNPRQIVLGWKRQLLKIKHKDWVAQLHNSDDSSSDTPLWIVGFSRSGTTWLSEIICSTLGYREIFEPFHPYRIKKIKGYQPYLYLTSNKKRLPNAQASNKEKSLHQFYDNVFAGQFFDVGSDVNLSKINFNGLCVKIPKKFLRTQ